MSLEMFDYGNNLISIEAIYIQFENHAIAHLFDIFGISLSQLRNAYDTSPSTRYIDGKRCLLADELLQELMKLELSNDVEEKAIVNKVRKRKQRVGQLRNKFAEADAGAKGFLTNEEISQLLKQTSWLKGMRVDPADLASIDCDNPNLRLSYEELADQIFTAVAVNKRREYQRRDSHFAESQQQYGGEW